MNNKYLKIVILVLSLLIPLELISCGFPGDPMIDDMYTRNIYPGTTNTYDIGSLVLQYHNGYFENLWLNGVAMGAGGALALDDLTDVDAPAPVLNDVLTWDGADWINQVGGSVCNWTVDADGIQYLDNVGIHTASSATELLSLYSSDGISNDPVLSVFDNSASVQADGIHVNMAGAKTDYTDGIYISNLCTTASAGADKYGLRIKSTGNWLGVGSVNSALYIETPTGGTANYSIYSEGGANYLAGTLSLGDVLDLGTHQIENVVDPNDAQDAATKAYVDENINYAEMYCHENGATTEVQDQNDWHLINGFTTGQVGGGWSFHAGEQLAMTAFANNGDGKTRVTVAAHTLINGDIISISGTTSYDGVWIVEQVAVNTFVINTPWVADDGASVGEHGSHFHSATATSTGKYIAQYSFSVEPGAANCQIELSLYYNATQEIKSESRNRLSVASDAQLMAGQSIIDITVNGVISVAVRNLTDTNDITVRDGNLTLIKLD